MLYTIEFGQPCQQWGCPQMESDAPREIIPFGACTPFKDSNYYNKLNCNCCYDCYIQCVDARNKSDASMYD